MQIFLISIIAIVILLILIEFHQARKIRRLCEQTLDAFKVVCHRMLRKEEK